MQPSERIDQTLALAGLALIIIGCYLVLRPFLTGLLWAVILVVTLWPMNHALRRRVKPGLASLVMVTLISLLDLVPFAIVTEQVAANGPRSMVWLRRALENVPDPPAWVAAIPLVTLTLDDLKQHRHLVVRVSGALRSRSGGWLNERRWTVTIRKATPIRAATLGLGYAWYPADSIRQEIESGTLKPLPLEQGRERFVTLYLVQADMDTARPGARRLAEIIRSAVAADCERAALHSRQERQDYGRPVRHPGSPK